MQFGSTIATFHNLLVVLLVSLLAAQVALLSSTRQALPARSLARVDIAYGICAVALLGVGVARVIWGGKGAAYYLGNGWFMLKIGAFLSAAILSLIPTLQYRRWVRDKATISADRVSRMRSIVLIESGLVAVIVVAATNLAWGR